MVDKSDKNIHRIHCPVSKICSPQNSLDCHATDCYAVSPLSHYVTAPPPFRWGASEPRNDGQS